MGFDIKATADAAGRAIDSLPNADTISKNLPPLESLRPYTGILFTLGALVTISAVLKHTSIGRRATRALEEALFGNWRLALLGATGLVLSLASGYTTWDGMRAFTGEPVLAGMVTFGIQGVMLIVAWLIGESFASGMSVRVERGAYGAMGRATPWLGGLVGTLLFIAVAFVLLQSAGADVHRAAADVSWVRLGDKMMIIVAGLLAIALLAVYAASDLVAPYLQSGRIIVKNAVLWIMFFSCMATSVFFSFNSLFSVIFPQDQRVRATELRAQNQVAGIVSDIGAAITTMRLTEAEDLFNSDGWRAYDKVLAELTRAAQTSSGEIEKYFNDKIEDRNRAIKQQQERIVTAQSSQAGLAAKKVSLTDELSQLEAGRPALAADLAEKKTALDERAKEVDAKRVEAMAEDKGVEGTGKIGKGPIYRQRVDELSKLQDYYKIGEERVKDAQKRLTAAETRIAQIKRELAAIDGDLAKYKGEAETAEQRIKLTQEAAPADQGARIDPAHMVPAFENARAEFREQPTSEHLGKVQQLCTQIYTAMATATPDTKKKVAGVDCDPKQAAEAANVVFALNTGADVFARQCQGGDKLNAAGSADALFAFARKCLSDSGLPSKETDSLRAKINTIELNRDDKAHPLVATVNAFQDGNKLAYLALFIAVSMDMLVFMSGLFGANAVRSPLQDVPSLKARTAQQLEAIIENALLPHKYESAKAIIDAMRPMTPHDGFTARVHISDGDPHANDIARVLNAGAAIGAVRHVGGNDYELRAELFEFLSIVAKKAFEADKRHVTIAELEKVVTVALLPDIGDNAQVVLDHLHPITEDRGFTAQVHLAEIDDQHKRVVRNALNAGATLQVVQRVGTDSASYFIHGDFYKALARIRARSLIVSPGHAQIAAPQRPSSAPLEGGRAREHQEQLSAAPRARELPPPLPQRAALDRAALRRFYRGQLLAAIGLNDSAVEQRLTADGVPEAARDAWKMLTAQAQRNTRLEHYMRWHQEQLSQSLGQTYSSLLSAADGDKEKIDLLDEVDNEIQNSLTMLMLFPETDLLDALVRGLEEPAQYDDGQAPGEQALLDRLRQVRHSMDQLDLATSEAWQQIGRALQSLDDQTMPNVLRYPQQRRSDGRA